MSFVVRNFDDRQINHSVNYSIEFDDFKNYHNVKTYNRPNTKKAKEIMWEIVHELTQIYKISKEDSLDIAIDKFAELQLNSEESVTVENLALLRVSCWFEADKFTKK